MGSLFRLEEQK